ncbi:hypothetical protein FA13DRAFT_1796156 [Coprinellus micaceus]|uniref:Ribonuclease H1 N-terminal domain-containing protein n=1 Tax=Coprinellus micaceus TaxID=71717 RepID=A0A4Y7SVV2_COPMI|nr:hypothetical protein FA13DRAFT_1796156 [Coprinellus micaceus]
MRSMRRHGYTLVPLDEFDHCGSADDEHNVQEPPSSLASTRANSPDLSLEFGAEMASVLGLCRAVADVPSDVTPLDSVAAPVDDDTSSPGPAPTTDPTILVAGSSASVTIGGVVTTPPMTGPPVTAAVSTPSGQAPPPITAAPAGQGLPVITPNVPGGSALAPLPPASTVIAGLNPLGPNHPVPLPVDTIFAKPNQAHYYAVTKGIRVGVFTGWQNTSPYVTGVSGAVYARCANLHIAFAAYSEAFGRGAVRYI